MTHIPLTILPKFLWKHIITCLTYADIVKLIMVNNQFDGILNDDTWRKLFLENRRHAIAIVKCSSSRINHFWKHAVESNIGFDTIGELLQFIVDDNTSDSFIYYKVFIKSGEYLFANPNRVNYILGKKPCSIEINGNKTVPCTSTLKYYDGNAPKYDGRDRGTLTITISKYFSVKHITFLNLYCIFQKYDFCTRWMPLEDDFSKTYDSMELYMFNCIFDGFSRFVSSSINKIVIDSCQFNTWYTIHFRNILYRYQAISKNILKYNLGTNVECIISNSLFAVEKYCINCHDTITMQFINNRVINASSVFYYFNNKKSSIIINNNNISNVKYLLQMCHNITISNNVFTNVKKFDNGYSTNITLDDNNRFESCGTKFMDQVAQLQIENTIQ